MVICPLIGIPDNGQVVYGMKNVYIHFPILTNNALFVYLVFTIYDTETCFMVLWEILKLEN